VAVIPGTAGIPVEAVAQRHWGLLFGVRALVELNGLSLFVTRPSGNRRGDDEDLYRMPAVVGTFESAPQVPVVLVEIKMRLWSGEAAQVGGVRRVQDQRGRIERRLEGWPDPTQGWLRHGQGRRTSEVPQR
jgi:hypothetical protein